MSNVVKAFITNIVVFGLIALAMFLMIDNPKKSLIILSKWWIWISACIIGYYVIVQLLGKGGENNEE